MGMHASANVVYGVDLGDPEYGEEYVEYPDTYEDGLADALEDLIKEFRTQVSGPEPQFYLEDRTINPEWRAWRDTTHVGYCSYGYEWCGTVVCSASAGGSELSAEPISLGETNHDELEKFLQFLESKGFQFTNPEKRKPGWLVLSSYG